MGSARLLLGQSRSAGIEVQCIKLIVKAFLNSGYLKCHVCAVT